MINREALKEIIISNEEFILNKVGSIVARAEMLFPKEVNKVIIFYGIRRSGKTHILYDLFRKNKDNALYVDFEDERLSEFRVEDFETLKDAFLELKPSLAGKEIVVLLDEVQNVAGWEKFVRRTVERDNARAFVTGSSSKIMPKEIQTSLRGRSWSIEVSTFSFKEKLVLEDINVGNKPQIYGAKKHLIKKHFLEYLKWGGFPEVLLIKSDVEKMKVIKEYLDAMFFKDLIERFKISNVNLLSVLMENLFSSFSAKMSLTSFYKRYKDKFPFSKDLLFSYYKHLIDSMLVYEVRKFSESSYKRNRNPAKIYVADVGICRKVTSNDSGRVLENMVFLGLKKRGNELFYYEEKKECDFILKDFEGNFSAYQATYELNEGNRDREITGLVDACKYLSLKEGRIFTFDQEDKDVFGNVKIRIIPVWKWLMV